MRIESVTLTNLASLEGTWYIPLNELAYQESGIFAITGKTGSGKSTILDAICFTLYRATPRLGTDIQKLISRSKNSGSAQVVFIVENQRYRASHLFHKAGKSGKGKSSTSELYLENLTKNISYIDKPSSAVKQYHELIESIVGMTFAQFRQSILLAQGEFAAFLTADAHERANILEYLTDSYIYGKISIYAYNYFKEQEQKAKSYQEQLQLLSTNNEIVNPTEELNGIKHIRKEKEQHLASLQQESKKLTAQIDTLIRWSEEEEKLKNYQQALAILKKEEEIKTHNYQHFLKEFDIFQHNYPLQENHLTAGIALQSQIAQEEIRLSEKLVNQQKREELLGEYHSKFDRILEEKKMLEQELSHLSAQMPSKESIFTHEKISALQVSKEILTKMFTQWQSAEMRWLSPEKVEAWADYREAKEQLARWIAPEYSLEVHEKAYLYHQECEKITLFEEEISAYQCEKEKISVELGELSHLLEKREIEQFSYSMSLKFFDYKKNLFDKDSCPLCEQPLLHLPEFNEMKKQEMERQLHETEEFISNMQLHKKTLEAQFSRLEERIESLHRHLQSVNLLLEDLRKELPSPLKEISFETMQAMHQEIIMHEKRGELLRNKVSKGLSLEYEYQNYLDICNEFTELFHNTVASSVEFSLTNNLIDDYSRYQEYLTETFLAYDHYLKYLQDAEHCRKKIEQNEQETIYLQENIDRTMRECEELRGAIAKDSTSLSAQRQSFDMLYGEADIVLSLSQLREEKERFVQQHDFLNHDRIIAQEKCEQQNLWIKQCKEQINNYKNRYEYLSNYSFCSSEIATILLELNRLLEKNKLDHEQIVTEYHKCIRQEGVLDEQLRAFMAREEKNRQLMVEYDAFLADFAVVQEMNRLIGSADGKKLKSFAQALTLEQVILMANHYLSFMQDRYKLARNEDESLHLVVIDLFDGDRRRETQTLSGGERFILSLALALGLANLASEKVKIESFFLDEGFGSLDQESLDLVLNALVSLKDMGKIVGLISHVETLKERIDYKIEVRSLGNGRSELRGLGVELRKESVGQKELF
ncbi:SbcC/MukB-like Walker B domain-containing protein [Entomospira culicis]|uniref:Exonuclease SbcC n=1 Tax=Entomospira culicis TaxID=2719989 RepID=A0A968GI09_9SPIO|nr:AAA family ATPase [Entomospira culicis]NIZ19193.1 hypothetical protein [Entomospira culicis]NIZ69407.1 hypothetical protein [Entomospira culicis]WDI36524.1 SbcC/MukB-like Walker B domain-containing protein [Entomospira culicis]WDI38150.1 SbcC/MukB-like Walker B domain-containing protein [Entomospira culicis]